MLAAEKVSVKLRSLHHVLIWVAYTIAEVFFDEFLWAEAFRSPLDRQGQESDRDDVSLNARMQRQPIPGGGKPVIVEVPGYLNASIVSL